MVKRVINHVNKRLSNLVKSIAASGFIVVGSASMSGCETTPGSGSDEALLGLALGGLGSYAMGSGDLQRMQAGATAQQIGGGLVQYGSAKAGRSDVQQNVYVNPNPQMQGNAGANVSADVNGEREFIITANKFAGYDVNGNGIWDEGDFIGVKDVFKQGEEIVLAIYSPNLSNGDSLRIYTLDGEEAYTDIVNSNPGRGSITYWDDIRCTKPQVFKAVISTGDKQFVKIFEIVPSDQVSSR